MSATGTNITDLHELGKHDKETSDDLQRRIEDLKQTLESGHKPETAATLGAMETEGKKILKDLTRRIEEIEGRGNLDATDREMLRLLTVRQVVIDKQVMQLAELRDLIHVSHGINWYENKRLAGSGNILQRHEKPRLLKKWAKQDAEQASEPSTEAVPATEASPGEPLTTDPTNAHSPGCGLEVVAEHIQHGDDDETGDQEAVHESEEEFEQVFDDYNRPVYGVRYDDEDEDEDEEEEEPEPEVDKSDCERDHFNPSKTRTDCPFLQGHSATASSTSTRPPTSPVSKTSARSKLTLVSTAFLFLLTPV